VIAIDNLARATVLGTHIRVAENAWSRAVGLLGQKGLDPGGGLLIDPSSGIHTWGMGFAIDVIALNGHRQVIGVWPELGRFRVAALNWRTRSVLELPAGTIRASRTAVGDQLQLRS
jgi:hypothetical protein